ncbi:1 TM domain-containing transmembrane protein [Acrasis kona]|uniref:1 TM domain-containing transmembrane protein n=1 Tax=Acrasis kona TaxID=1008807 RepID=A0AAW2Z8R5_9EUKA
MGIVEQTTQIDKPTAIIISEPLYGKKITRVAIGCESVFLLASDNNIYRFGRCDEPSCWNGLNENDPTAAIEVPKNKIVTQMNRGCSMSVLLVDDINSTASPITNTVQNTTTNYNSTGNTTAAAQSTSETTTTTQNTTPIITTSSNSAEADRITSSSSSNISTIISTQIMVVLMCFIYFLIR